MNCSNCGAKNLEGASFCKKCGNKLKETNLEPVKNDKKKNISRQPKQKKICDCGFELEEDYNFCPNCKKDLKQSSDDLANNSLKKEKENFYISLYIILVIAAILIALMKPLISFLCLFLAFIVTIIGRFRCPKNMIIMILFWVNFLSIGVPIVGYIILTILYIFC